MKKSLKEYRKIKQLSQQELSDMSGISIRTIQRIENNQSAGSPYVIKSLCKAMEIELEAIEWSSLELESAKNQPDEASSTWRLDHISDPAKSKLKFINLSAVLVLLCPFLNLIIPATLYWKYRNDLNDKSEALRILSFQIVWTVFTLLSMLFIPTILQILFEIFEIARFPVFFWVYFICVGVNILITFDTAIRLNKSENILPAIPSIL